MNAIIDDGTGFALGWVHWCREFIVQRWSIYTYIYIYMYIHTYIHNVCVFVCVVNFHIIQGHANKVLGYLQTNCFGLKSSLKGF